MTTIFRQHGKRKISKISSYWQQRPTTNADNVTHNKHSHLSDCFSPWQNLRGSSNSVCTQGPKRETVKTEKWAGSGLWTPWPSGNQRHCGMRALDAYSATVNCDSYYQNRV